MKTDVVGISGQKEEASKEKEMCGIVSLNRQGSLDSNREDGRATLILTLTLCNLRKTELPKAAKVFEVQTSPFLSSTEHSLLSLLPLLLPLCIYPISPFSCSLPDLCLHLPSPFVIVLVLLQLLREVGWSLQVKEESVLQGGSSWTQSFRRIVILCKGCLEQIPIYYFFLAVVVVSHD